MVQLSLMPDIDFSNEENRRGVDTTCIICLEDMKVAKKLNCGHMFHQQCLRSLVEHNAQCPTCRTQIVLTPRETQPRPQDRPNQT